MPVPREFFSSHASAFVDPGYCVRVDVTFDDPDHEVVDMRNISSPNPEVSLPSLDRIKELLSDPNDGSLGIVTPYTDCPGRQPPPGGTTAPAGESTTTCYDARCECDEGYSGNKCQASLPPSAAPSSSPSSSLSPSSSPTPMPSPPLPSFSPSASPSTSPSAATCGDDRKNGLETGKDCGGPDCPKCDEGQICDHDGDCISGECGDGPLGARARRDIRRLGGRRLATLPSFAGFEDVASAAGLDAAPCHGGSSHGASWVDYDGDYDEDLFVACGAGVDNVLYRNEGGGTFVPADISESGMTGKAEDGRAGVWGDYDGDGNVDLYLVNLGPDVPNVLFRNVGGGSFDDVTSMALPALGNNGRGRSAAWGDLNNARHPVTILQNILWNVSLRTAAVDWVLIAADCLPDSVTGRVP